MKVSLVSLSLRCFQLISVVTLSGLSRELCLYRLKFFSNPTPT